MEPNSIFFLFHLSSSKSLDLVLHEPTPCTRGIYQLPQPFWFLLPLFTVLRFLVTRLPALSFALRGSHTGPCGSRQPAIQGRGSKLSTSWTAPASLLCQPYTLWFLCFSLAKFHHPEISSALRAGIWHGWSKVGLSFCLFILFADGWALCPLRKADWFKIQPLSVTWLHHRSWKDHWH